MIDRAMYEAAIPFGAGLLIAALLWAEQTRSIRKCGHSVRRIFWKSLCLSTILLIVGFASLGAYFFWIAGRETAMSYLADHIPQLLGEAAGFWIGFTPFAGMYFAVRKPSQAESR